MSLGKRDLLFVAILMAGAAALASSLVPTHEAPPAAVDTAPPPAVERLDAALVAGWQAAGVKPVGTAAELGVARRLSLALCGTVPSLAEVRWLEAQPSATRLGAWTERLLADPRTDDYLAEQLARATVGTELGPFFVYRRRRFVAWISDQLRAGLPYDRLVRELIASEGLWTERPAVNFLTVAIVQPANDLDEVRLAGAVCRAFLGVRMDCAACHDHPFAPWKQEDFQGLAAFFGTTHQTNFAGIRDGRGRYEYTMAGGQVKPLPPAVPFASELLPADGRRRERLAAWVTHPDNRAFARATVNRVWSWMFGRPLVEPVDDLPLDGIGPPALDVLAAEFRASGYQLKPLIRTIAASRAFRLASRAADETAADNLDALVAVQAAFPLTPLTADQVASAVVQSASLATLDRESPIVLRFARQVQLDQFTARYGDASPNDPHAQAQTIARRLVLLNGDLVADKAKTDLANTVTRAALLAGDDATAIETLYLCVLTRRPADAESAHFLTRLQGLRGNDRQRALEDLYVVLLNSTEFLCNH